MVAEIARRRVGMALLVASWGIAGIAALACSAAKEPVESANAGPITREGDAGSDVASACAQGDNSPPLDLACTGLYADMAAKRLAPQVRSYAPGVTLWTDGAAKQRFVYLPGPIDAKDPGAWIFPVGTRFWKEFALGGRRVETRFLWKYGPTSWATATYVWSADGTSARRDDDGSFPPDLAPYEIPSSKACEQCHRGAVDHVMGFEAVGLALPGATGLDLATLDREHLLAPAVPSPVPIDASPAALAALGWLHANCGNTCHNGSPNATGRLTGMRLRLSPTGGGSLEDTDVYKTAVGRPATTPRYAGALRIAPGSPESSLVVQLATLRGQGQMPPIGSHVVDESGAALLRTWIGELSGAPDAGAPADASSVDDAGDGGDGGR
ncbi:MAG: hypothetical protein HOO96_28405 [Polyangiaceae bacterium]|nr:hypothetical protein [Polyangiaceae bacterium]